MSDVLPPDPQALPDRSGVTSQARIDTASGLPDPAGQRSAAAANRGTILVIDPAPLSLIATAGVLDSDGWVCLCARTATAALTAAQQQPLDLLVADVGDDAAAMLQLLTQLRSGAGAGELPAVLIADPQWSGLEQQTERLAAVTRCLFKPIDPGALLAVVDQLSWLPQLAAAYRKQAAEPGQTAGPARPGWISL